MLKKLGMLITLFGAIMLPLAGCETMDEAADETGDVIYETGEGIDDVMD